MFIRQFECDYCGARFRPAAPGERGADYLEDLLAAKWARLRRPSRLTGWRIGPVVCDACPECAAAARAALEDRPLVPAGRATA